MQSPAKRIVPILFCLLAAPAFAAFPRWTLLGPDGQDGQLLAASPSNPDVLYATAFSEVGIFRSLDGARTWSWPEAKPLVPGNLYPSVIAVDPRQPATVYLGSAGYGLAKSTDGGATWSAFQTFGRARAVVLALAIDPHRTNVLFVSLQGLGIFRSNDGGSTWSRTMAGLPPASVPAWALAVDPQRPNVVLAGFQVPGVRDRNLYRSKDGGATWTAAVLPEGQGLEALAFSGGRPVTAYALADGGLYKSINDGASWTPATLPFAPGSRFTRLAAHPKDPRTLLVSSPQSGIFRSRDGGATWTPFNAGLPGLSTFVDTLAYNAQGTVAYAGTFHGVFQSSGGGAWTRVMHGFATAQTTAVALGPGDPPVLWAGAPDLGLYRSINHGGVWRRVPLPGFVFWVDDVIADPDHPGTVFVLVRDSPQGPFKTVDAGRTWTSLPVAGPFQRLLRDPDDGALLLLGTGTILRSVDGGQTWTPSAAGIEAGDTLLDVAFDPLDPRLLYAGGIKPSTIHLHPPEPRLYKSADGGLTWARSEDGLVAPAGVQRVAVSRTGVYAAAGDALFRSLDAGAHWKQTATTPNNRAFYSAINDLAAAPDGTLYIATATGVYATGDGAAWTPVSDGLASLYVNDLLLDPLDPDHLYAATDAGGIAVLPLDE